MTALIFPETASQFVAPRRDRRRLLALQTPVSTPPSPSHLRLPRRRSLTRLHVRHSVITTAATSAVHLSCLTTSTSAATETEAPSTDSLVSPDEICMSACKARRECCACVVEQECLCFCCVFTTIHGEYLHEIFLFCPCFASSFKIKYKSSLYLMLSCMLCLLKRCVTWFGQMWLSLFFIFVYLYFSVYLCFFVLFSVSFLSY